MRIRRPLSERLTRTGIEDSRGRLSETLFDSPLRGTASLPVRLLTVAERDRLSRFTAEVSPEDLAAYVTFSGSDLDMVRRQRGDANRLGVAVRVVALRLLGFVPDDVGGTLEPVVRTLAKQIGSAPSALDEYGRRFETVRGHQALAMDHLGIRRATGSEIAGLDPPESHQPVPGRYDDFPHVSRRRW